MFSVAGELVGPAFPQGMEEGQHKRRRTLHAVHVANAECNAAKDIEKQSAAQLSEHEKTLAVQHCRSVSANLKVLKVKG